MKKLAIIGAIILGATGSAFAQTADGQETKGIGSQVRDLAKAQRDSDVRGIGAEVKLLAQQQSDADEDDSDDQDDDENAAL